MELMEFFQRGGPLMYLIAFASVIGLAAYLERLFALQKDRVIPKRITKEVIQMVKAGNIDHAQVMLRENQSPLATIFDAILRYEKAPLPLVKEAAEEAGRQEAARLERFTTALGSVASVTPLMGLLGTVTGMIVVFQRVAQTGVGDPLEMAAGIWESLLTTAFGLAVGIPALIAHRHTLRRIDGLILELEAESLRLVETMERLKATETLSDTKMPES